MKKQGAVLFIIMGVLMICAFIMYTSMRNISYLATLVYEREKGEINYYYAYSLQQFVLHNYQDDIKKASLGKTSIFSADWPDKNSGYRGYAWIESKKGIKALHIEIKKDRKSVTILSSIVEQHG